MQQTIRDWCYLWGPSPARPPTAQAVQSAQGAESEHRGLGDDVGQHHVVAGSAQVRDAELFAAGAEHSALGQAQEVAGDRGRALVVQDEEFTAHGGVEAGDDRQGSHKGRIAGDGELIVLGAGSQSVKGDLEYAAGAQGVVARDGGPPDAVADAELAAGLVEREGDRVGAANLAAGHDERPGAGADGHVVPLEVEDPAAQVVRSERPSLIGEDQPARPDPHDAAGLVHHAGGETGLADEHLVALGDAGAADVQRRRVGGVVCDHVGDVQVAGGEQVPAGQGVGGGVVLPDADPVVGADGAAALRADAHAHSPALFGGDHERLGRVDGAAGHVEHAGGAAADDERALGPGVAGGRAAHVDRAAADLEHARAAVAPDDDLELAVHLAVAQAVGADVSLTRHPAGADLAPAHVNHAAVLDDQPADGRGDVGRVGAAARHEQRLAGVDGAAGDVEPAVPARPRADDDVAGGVDGAAGEVVGADAALADLQEALGTDGVVGVSDSDVHHAGAVVEGAGGAAALGDL